MFGVAAALAGLCLGLVGAELLVRTWEKISGASEEFTYEASRQFKDLHRLSTCPGLPYELRPGATATIRYGGGSAVQYRISKHGMRGPELSDDAVLRVLLLGDSVTFGYYAREESTFASLLAGHLGGGDSCVTLNGAVGGYNTYTELQWYRCHGRSLNPHIVVLCFCPNDVDDPYGHFSWHTLEALGELPAEMYPNPARSERLRESRARAARSWGWRLWQETRRGSRLAWRASLLYDRRVGAGRRPFLDCLVALADTTSAESRWFAANLERLRREIPRGTLLVVAVLPLRYQMSTTRYDRALGSVESTARRLGVPVLNLVSRLRGMGTVCYLDASHLSSVGHRTVASAMGAFLRERHPVAAGRSE
jgi:hypothetical protein